MSPSTGVTNPPMSPRAARLAPPTMGARASEASRSAARATTVPASRSPRLHRWPEIGCWGWGAIREFELIYSQGNAAPLPTVLLHETEAGHGDRGSEPAEEGQHRPHSTPGCHEKAEGSRLAADSFGRKTLLDASSIRRTEEYADVPKPRLLGHPGNGPCHPQPVVPVYPEIPQLDPGLAP